MRFSFLLVIMAIPLHNKSHLLTNHFCKAVSQGVNQLSLKLVGVCMFDEWQFCRTCPGITCFIAVS